MNCLKKGFYIKYKWHTMIEFMFLQELMLIKQANQKGVVLVTIGIF